MLKTSFCFFRSEAKVIWKCLLTCRGLIKLLNLTFYETCPSLFPPPSRLGPEWRPVARHPFGRQGQLRHANDRWGRHLRCALRLAPCHQHRRDVSPGRWGSTRGRHVGFNNKEETLSLCFLINSHFNAPWVARYSHLAVKQETNQTHCSSKNQLIDEFLLSGWYALVRLCYPSLWVLY